MDLDTISNLRLQNQCIAKNSFSKPAELIQWMGAIQAQDFPMSRWAIGLRIHDSTESSIQSSLDKGEIVRTHVLRPTWHIIPARDSRWMIALSAPRIRTSMRSRHKQLGLTTAVINKSNKIIEGALKGGNHLRQRELVEILKKSKIRNEDNRVAHLLALAELDCLICSGVSEGGQHTYALFDERVPTSKSLNQEEGMARLAHTYFTSHGPATLQDFVWWSGLSITDARNALEQTASDLISEEVEKETYWFKDQEGSKSGTGQVHLLPAYDEFLISYKSRMASIPMGKTGITISNNGIFKPIIVVDGKVAGIWRRTTKSKNIMVETDFFKKPTREVMKEVAVEARNFGEFLGKEVMID